jgi:hypothetical protein
LTDQDDVDGKQYPGRAVVAPFDLWHALDYNWYRLQVTDALAAGKNVLYCERK